MVGYVSFGIAFTFISITSVMPALAGQLTDSAPLVGLVGTVFAGGWFLPQLVAARYIKDKPRKKPYILIALVGRISLVTVALALWGGLARYPSTMLGVYYACIAVFSITDGFGSVPWFDVLRRAIPRNRRGRLIGTSQVISGVAGIGVGALVSLILGSSRLRFPDNYALLFGLASVALLPSTAALIALREPPPLKREPTDDGKPSHWLSTVIRDPMFRRLVLTRLLVSMVDLATAFYVGHAARVLHMPERVIGTFVVAQTIGGIAASAILGLASERWGAGMVIRLGSATTILAPLFALAAHQSQSDWLVRGYPFIFGILGALNAVRMLGFSNYILEIAPEEMCPAYVGLANTLTGAVTIVPTLGGWLLQATSYTTLFAVSAALVAAGFGVSLTLQLAHGQTTLPEPSQTGTADDGSTVEPRQSTPAARRG
jgi:MFS family permease